MRVLNILEEGRWGGPQKRVLNVAKRLQSADVETTVYFSSYESDIFEKKLIDEGVPYFRVALHRITKKLDHLFKYIYTFRSEVERIKNCIEKNQIDLVHVNGSFQIKGLFAARKASVPSIWHMNDTHVTAVLYWLFKNNFARLPSAYIFAGERVKNYYTCALNENAHSVIIPAPVDTNRFNKGSVSASGVRANPDTIVVTMVGNWTPLKGHQLFIDAAIHVLQNIENMECQFVLVGASLQNKAGYLEQTLNNISDKYRDKFTTLTEISDVRPILKETDVYVCCSTFEASPTSVWEAMSMELPIVTTNVGDVEKYVRDENCGFVVDARDGALVGGRILELIEQRSARVECGKNSRRVAEAQFGIENVVDKHLEIYRSSFK